MQIDMAAKRNPERTRRPMPSVWFSLMVFTRAPGPEMGGCCHTFRRDVLSKKLDMWLGVEARGLDDGFDRKDVPQEILRHHLFWRS